MTEANGAIAAVLRAAGHDDAASIVDAIDKANATRMADEVEQPRPVLEPQRQSIAADAEAQRQREGEAMMAALRESIPNIYDDR